ncbi:unnamed protein product [Absidia cylindrospora]
MVPAYDINVLQISCIKMVDTRLVEYDFYLTLKMCSTMTFGKHMVYVVGDSMETYFVDTNREWRLHIFDIQDYDASHSC